jgi:peptide/nickel transport system permease protein
MRARYGLDQPLLVQYVRYVTAVAGGDLGHSYEYQRPVAEVILERLPATLLLTGAAFGLAVVLGLLIGVVTAVGAGSWFDMGLRVGTSALFAAPVFWTGQLLLLAFAVTLPVFPVGGISSLRGEPGGTFADLAWHLALPAACLSFGFLAVLSRIVRSGVLAEIRREYVRAAHARGLTRVRAALAHALPNALVPAVTIIGHQAGGLLTGASLVEVVFGWPGLGRLLLDATAQRDYPLVIAVLLTVSLLVVAANVITDAAYAVVEPRLQR